jgi:two-component system, NarL family, invasion response regulator UvrY
MQDDSEERKTLIKLLLVDDHDLVRTGLKRLLGDLSDFTVLGEAATGEQACNFCRRHSQELDIVLMDMRMPGMGGIEATRKITRMPGNIRVVALTSSKDTLVGRQFLSSGAAGFLSKDSSFNDLETAIREVHAGGSFLDSNIAQRMALQTISPDQSPFDRLSARELQVCLMISGGEKIVAIAEVMHVLPKTVNTYRYRIFDKLQISSDVALAKLAYSYGLVDISRVTSG